MANTTNLNLVKPAGTDYALVSVINDNMDIIDSKVGAIPANESAQSQITALNNQITNANTSTEFPNLSYGNYNGLKFISGFFTGNGTSSIYLGLGNCSGVVTTRNGTTGALETYYVSGGNISGYDGSTSRIFTNNVSYMISGVLKNS